MDSYDERDCSNPVNFQHIRDGLTPGQVNRLPYMWREEFDELNYDDDVLFLRGLKTPEEKALEERRRQAGDKMGIGLPTNPNRK